MLNIIQYEDIKERKLYFPKDLNTKSRLYIDSDLIHKIPFFPLYDLKDVLEYIDKLKLKELVEIKNLIYKHDKFIGYSMKNYKEYISLENLRKRNFELKKEDSLRIINIFNTLSSNNLTYGDLHLGNILFNEKNNDMKLCDLDGLELTKKTEIYEEDLESLLTTILSYLYDIENSKILSILNSDGIKDKNYFINFCCFNKNKISIDNITYLLKQIKLNYILNEKEDILNYTKKLEKR